MKVNDFIKMLRENAGFSRKGFSKISGFKDRAILSYENGERTVSGSYLEMVSAYFGLHPNLFQLEEISPEDAEKYRLCQFSWALRKYLFWSGRTIDELLDQMFEDAGRGNPFFSANDKKYLRGFISITERGYLESADAELLQDMENIIVHLRHFKPSEFGLDPDSESLLLSQMEKTGLALTEENVKKSMTSGIMIQNPKHQRIIELLPYCSDPCLDSIIQKLEAVKKAAEMLASAPSGHRIALHPAR